ncbi:hypothetical protein KY320_01375 [Candidatus Woesearchaeota archaeon]|nr:hypothetical protein [Candidatus Woesearchaeota archaeon]
MEQDVVVVVLSLFLLLVLVLDIVKTFAMYNIDVKLSVVEEYIKKLNQTTQVIDGNKV